MDININFTPSLVWNKEKRLLIFKNEVIKLSKSETILFSILVENLNRPISCEDLFYQIFEYYKEYSAQSIRVLISKLRKKIPIPLVENIYGSEYIIRSNTIQTQNNIELDTYLYDILDQIDHGVAITNPNENDNPIIYVNKKFLETFGYTNAEILGKNCRILQHTNAIQPNISKLREAIHKQIPITVDLINYTKDLAEVKVELTVNPIFDRKTGKIKYFLGMQKVLK